MFQGFLLSVSDSWLIHNHCRPGVTCACTTVVERIDSDSSTYYRAQNLHQPKPPSQQTGQHHWLLAYTPNTSEKWDTMQQWLCKAHIFRSSKGMLLQIQQKQILNLKFSCSPIKGVAGSLVAKALGCRLQGEHLQQTLIYLLGVLIPTKNFSRRSSSQGH